MLEQKDLVIQQLQSQIEELEHKSMSNKEDMEVTIFANINNIYVLFKNKNFILIYINNYLFL